MLIPRDRLATRVREALATGGVLLTAGAGYGKSTILDQALQVAPTPVAWVSCSETERAPEILLKRILDAISAAAPGAADALAERLAFPQERVDPIAAVRELLAELSQLLVESLVVVIDDSEQLEGADGALQLLSELIRAEIAPLHVAVAGRRPLELRVGKTRTAGRLTELTGSDLAFDSEECAALLSSRSGRDPLPEEIARVMEATEGWPLGIALIAPHLSDRLGRNTEFELREMRSADDLRSFISEELLDSLDPELRAGAISSSVVRVVTPEIVRALELPVDFAERIERAGMLMRGVGGGQAFAFHPLVREFLLERLEVECGEEELRRLHRVVAPAVFEGGDPVWAIEHWLSAESWPDAVSAIERDGPLLVRTSGGLMKRWLSVLPADARALPAIRSLHGQLAWASGDFAGAIEALQDAIRGFREHPNPPADWLARSMLLDSLFTTGEVDALEEVVAGWDQPEAEAAGGLAPAAVMYAAAVLAAYARFDRSDSLAEAARSHPQSDLVGPADALRLAFADGPRGDLDELLAAVEAADRELQRFDPLNRRPHLLGAVAVIVGDRGEPERSLQLWTEIREIVRGGTAPTLADATHAWCALLQAQAGRLAEAEAELVQHQGSETGYRTYIAEVAPAVVASLRGDAAATVEHADRALDVVAGGPILFRSWAGADLVPALATVGREERAKEILEQTLEQLDEEIPGPRGRLHRGRLLAQRAWLRDQAGDADGSDSDLVALWEAAGGSLRFIIRREWERLQPPVWAALERGTLDAAGTIESISLAFPDGLHLVKFLEHPAVAVRRAALKPATDSGDPEALAHLGRLAEDADPELAAAASEAAERLARTLPPLHFELLGGFAVGRASWRVGDSWARPVDARLVRYLLVNVDQPVPEDLIIEALWPELEVKRARSSLQVSVSRARRVLDPPGAERSVIESADRSYRLALGERDLVDAEEFRSAADVALSEPGEQRLLLLQHAHSLWGGEPMQEDRYEDWAAEHRERLIDQYTAVLAALVEIREQTGEHAEAAEVARELVDLDPLNEGGHRALITAYAHAGRTGQALRQYLECRRALIDTLGIEPAEATSRLQAQILAGEPV